MLIKLAFRPISTNAFVINGGLWKNSIREKSKTCFELIYF